MAEPIGAVVLSKVSTNLDAKVSTRAAASTALDNGVWTDALAAKIDANLPVPAASSPIRGIQTGYVDTAGSTGTGEDVRYLDVTLPTPVLNVTKSFVYLQQNYYNFPCTARLLNTTTLRISNIGAVNLRCRWVVQEFN